MPWAWHMAQWCFDPLSSSLVQAVRFRMPYPRHDWYEERAWNAPLIEAMQMAAKADRIFSKDPESWDDEESHFFVWMTEGCATKETESDDDV